MEQKDQIETMVLACIDTAQAMLDKYGMVIPFGLRAFTDSDDMKMNCPAENNPGDNWQQQIENVVAELKEHLQSEPVAATVLVTELQAEEERGIGLQIETPESSALFVYPCTKDEEAWKIEEPILTEQLLATVF